METLPPSLLFVMMANSVMQLRLLFLEQQLMLKLTLSTMAKRMTRLGWTSRCRRYR